MAELDLDIIVRFSEFAADALARHREEIDALNVFPVPDADTGTNLYLTVAAARDQLRQSAPTDVPTALAAYARGALLGARGNSGVILAEMIGALMRRLDEAPAEEPRAHMLAAGMRAATEAAYAAVREPQEGTMLTVARAATDAAEKTLAGDPGARTRDVVTAAAEAARSCLAHTPDQLEALAAAGVIDAGGRGICVLLDAYETAVTGRRPSPTSGRAARRGGTRLEPVTVVPTVAPADLSEDGPSYEVMYLLDAPDDAVPALKEALAPLGDSLVVIGGSGLWNVHVHVDDVGAAIEAGMAAGRPHRIRVTHFAEQICDQRQEHGAPDRLPVHVPVGRKGRKVLAVSAGPGLTRLFEEAGAVVVERSLRQPPPSAVVLEAILASGAAEIIVLPNDHHSATAAEAAARAAEDDHGVRVAVIPTMAQVQGLAALAVHEPGRSFDRDVLEMTATARHARHGGVTLASRRAITMAGPCEPGDVLGVLDGDFVEIGSEVGEVAIGVLRRLIGGGGELVTIVSGADDGDGSLAREAAAWVEAHHPTVEAVVYDGGQERYHLLVSVE